AVFQAGRAAEEWAGLVATGAERVVRDLIVRRVGGRQRQQIRGGQPGREWALIGERFGRLCAAERAAVAAVRRLLRGGLAQPEHIARILGARGARREEDDQRRTSHAATVTRSVPVHVTGAVGGVV